MNNEIKVTVCKYPDRANLVLRYVAPLTGKQKTKSAGTPDEGDAIKEAGKWEDELRSGRYQAPNRLTWAEFRRRCDAEKLSAMPESSQVAYRVALDHFQRLIDPDRLAKLTPQVMSRFQAEARKEGMRATTLARHLRHIKACLRWGERQGLLAKAPAIEMPKLPKGQSLAKHRPVTAEEFDRMLAAVPKVRPHDAPAWRRLLWGLWLSGLRLSEAVALDWDSGPFVLDTTGKHPTFHIEAEGQKSRRAEIVPTTPDFAEWILSQTPEPERAGKVFNLADPKTGKPLMVRTVGPAVSAIGEKAGVVVTTSKATRNRRVGRRRIQENGKPAWLVYWDGERGEQESTIIRGTADKAEEECERRQDGKLVTVTVKAFAGAHDLRRAFCSRWARKVMPAVLQRLARHSHISTTMAYYVSLSADEIGADLWAKHRAADNSQGNILGNNAPQEAEKDAQGIDSK